MRRFLFSFRSKRYPSDTSGMNSNCSWLHLIHILISPWFFAATTEIRNMLFEFSAAALYLLTACKNLSCSRISCFGMLLGFIKEATIKKVRARRICSLERPFEIKSTNKHKKVEKCTRQAKAALAFMFHFKKTPQNKQQMCPSMKSICWTNPYSTFAFPVSSEPKPLGGGGRGGGEFQRWRNNPHFCAVERIPNFPFCNQTIASYRTLLITIRELHHFGQNCSVTKRFPVLYEK